MSVLFAAIVVIDMACRTVLQSVAKLLATGAMDLQNVSGGLLRPQYRSM